MPQVKPKLHKLQGLLEEKGLDGAIIVSPSNVQYYTGFRGGGAILVASGKGDATLLVPQLEYSRALKEAAELEVRPYYRYPLQGISMPRLIEGTWLEAINIVVSEYGFSKTGADLSSMSHASATQLKEKLGEKLVSDVSSEISKMRAVKDDDEIEVVKKAIGIAEEGLRKAVSFLQEGISELELAGIVDQTMRRAGASDYAFPTIVAFGENAAYPHAVPTERRLNDGDVVLIDLGARASGYCSDMTRTFGFGTTNSRNREMAEAVLEALYAGIDAISPGVKVEVPDEEARRVLNSRGLAKYFIHSLGHGVGIDVHEFPRLSKGTEAVLEPGMIVTVEPGIYLDGFLGVRIEDMVLVTRKGSRVLTSFERLFF